MMRPTMHTRIITAALLILATFTACDSRKVAVKSVEAPPVEAVPAVAPAPPLTDFEKKLAKLGREPYNWCDVFRGTAQGCVVCPPGPCPPSQASSIIHCCNSDGICVHVGLAGDCDPDDYVVICNYGQSNTDGSITCYE
jgi:hypothetical protein